MMNFKFSFVQLYRVDLLLYNDLEILKATMQGWICEFLPSSILLSKLKGRWQHQTIKSIAPVRKSSFYGLDAFLFSKFSIRKLKILTSFSRKQFFFNYEN